MTQQEIEAFLEILKQNNRHDLAHKFEKSLCKSCRYDNWNGGLWRLTFYVNPKYFLELSELCEKDHSFLIKILDAMTLEDIGEVGEIEFKINMDFPIEKIDDVLYIFVDESGDVDFSQKGSQYYIFSFLAKKRPFRLHETIASYRYSLLEKNFNLSENDKRLDIEKFHACEDNQYIREHLFGLISGFEKDSIKIYSYILEKSKVLPEKRKDKASFYSENLSFAITRLLEKIGIDKNFIVITDNLPVKKDKKKQAGAIKGGIKRYLKDNGINVRYDIFHHSSASSVNLQIVDYINWAIFRKYERGRKEFYDKISRYILDEEDMTKEREKKYY